MKNTIIALLLWLFIIASLAYAEYGAMPITEEKEKPPETWCPKTRITDNDKCFLCHTQPDFKLKESPPENAMDLPYGVQLVDGKLYYVVDAISGHTVAKFFKYLYWHPEFTHIVMEVHSYGGSLIEAWKVIALMDEAKKRGVVIETRCYAMAASAGFLIFVNGTLGERVVSRTAELMTHEIWSLAWLKVETPSKKEDEAKVMRHFQDTIHNWLVTRCTKDVTKDQIDEWVRHKDYWVNGAETIELGFAERTPG